jgi:hypothetical protein
MKIDVEYMRDLLSILTEHDHPDFRIDIPKIKSLWENDEKLNKFVFHMEILGDQSLIEDSINPHKGLGFLRSGNGGIRVSLKPLRLTAVGHQFASDLAKPGVMEKLKKSFKEAGPVEMIKIVCALGQKIIEQAL